MLLYKVQTPINPINNKSLHFQLETETYSISFTKRYSKKREYPKRTRILCKVSSTRVKIKVVPTHPMGSMENQQEFVFDKIKGINAHNCTLM